VFNYRNLEPRQLEPKWLRREEESHRVKTLKGERSLGNTLDRRERRKRGGVEKDANNKKFTYRAILS